MMTRLIKKQAFALFAEGKVAEALAVARPVMAQDPLLLNLAAFCHLRMGQPPLAESCWRQALHLKPDFADVHNNLGTLLQEQHRSREAEAAYRQALDRQPDHADACRNLCLLLKIQARHQEIEMVYRRILDRQPEHTVTLVQLGILLHEQKRWQEAEAVYRQILAIDPNHADTCDNLGLLLQEQQRYQEALVAHQQALAIRPDHVPTQWNLAVLLLFLGHWQEGWALYEARYHPARKDEHYKIPDVAFPMWRGEALQGKSLLIAAEQGFGDKIQFCRYARLLKAQGARHITLVCEAALAPLLASVDGVDRLLDVGQACPEHDFWTFLLSIPHHMKTTRTTLPASLPYVVPPPDRLSQWSRLLPPPGCRVGLVWRGNPMHHNDGNRSLAGLSVLAPLWSVPGVSFVSLQKGSGEEEARHPPPGQPLFHAGGLLRDFADTAGLVAHLDLVISIDSAVAHLAGAMGKPCWVLLPSRGVDWRWMAQRTDSPWYPGVMKLFRQTVPGDWNNVVQEVVRELTCWYGQSGT